MVCVMLLTDTLEAGAHRVTARAARPEDAAFLQSVYASTREQELAPVPWTDEEKRRFIAHQFSAQAEAYRKNYPGAEFLVLVVDGADAGRLYVHRRPDEIRIMDIALLPLFRRRGIGAAVLRRILDEGARRGKRVTIHVEIFNPAMRLYERLGFRQIASGRDDPVYRLMEWRAENGPAT